MSERKIEIIQTGGRFTLQRVEGGKTYVMASDRDGAVVGHEWWLNPAVFNLPDELKTWGCSHAQVRLALEALASGTDTHLEFDVKC